MGKKSQTRFVISIAGQRYELFSVRDRKENGLLVTVRRTDQMRLGEHHGDLLEQRFSIHTPSAADHGWTFKQTISLEDIEPADTYTHLTSKDGHMCWPIMALVMPQFDLSNRNDVSRSKDDTKIICDLPSLYSSLVYCIVVSDQATNLFHELSRLGNVTSAKFRRVNIYCIHGFYHVPPSQIGGISVPCTSSPRIGEVAMYDIPRIARTTPDAGEIGGIVHLAMLEAGQAYADNIAILLEDPELSLELRKEVATYDKASIADLPEHRD